MAIHSAAGDSSCAACSTVLIFEAPIILIGVFVFLCNIVLFLVVFVARVVVGFILRLCNVFGIWRHRSSAILIIGTLGEALIYFLLGYNLTANLVVCRAALLLLLFELFACSAPMSR